MRTLSRKSFAIGLLVALLVVYTGRAVPVSALAELAPEIAPVFDTQIYQLQDYIDNGGMTDPQLDIFYTLAGFYAMGQAGSENYKLTNPYSTQDGVLNWLKDLGVETYNTLIGLVPDTVRLPNGSIQSTEVIKKATSLYVANLMGCALKSYQYETYEDFEDDIENSEHFFMPWNKNTQYGLNTLYQLYGGIYNWQFDSQPFTSSTIYLESNIPTTNPYWNYYNNLSNKIRYNSFNTNNKSCVLSGDYFNTYTNLFLNTSTGKFAVVDDSGRVPANNSVSLNNLYYYFDSYMQYFSNSTVYNRSNTWWRDYPIYDTFVESVREIYNKVSSTNQSQTYFDSYCVFLEDFVDHVYVGDSWANRQEIFNLINLNFDDTGSDYYVTPADDDDYLLDIKGILNDILNTINLYGVYIDNLFSLDGVPVHDTDLIRITTDIYDLLNQQNPPLPVNLNDIAEYTDNTYLDRLKEHARNFGDTFAAYVAFWHNADHDLVYTIFGASIMVLIGAFIGKWGHS